MTNPRLHKMSLSSKPSLSHILQQEDIIVLRYMLRLM